MITFLLLIAIFFVVFALLLTLKRLKEAESDRELYWVWMLSWKRVARNLHQRLDANLTPGESILESWANGDGALLLESLIADRDDTHERYD